MDTITIVIFTVTTLLFILGLTTVMINGNIVQKIWALIMFISYMLMFCIAFSFVLKYKQEKVLPPEYELVTEQFYRKIQK